MSYDEKAAERVRQFLIERNDIVEKKMMGGMCFMVSGDMVCGISGAALMIRVGRDAYQETLQRPHVRPLEFGGRRPSGLVLVDPAGYRTDAALATWIRQGLAFVSTLPTKRSTTTKGGAKAQRKTTSRK